MFTNMDMERRHNGQGRDITRSAALFSLAYIGLQVAGASFPSAGAWGFHWLAFLGPGTAASIAIPAAIAVAAVLRNDPGPLLAGLSERILRNPLRALFAVCGIFAVLAIALRASVPVMGDGYTFLNNIGRTLNGEHDLGTGNEPLASAYFYAVAWLAGASTQQGVADAILGGEILLMAAFLAFSGASALVLFPRPSGGRMALCAISIVFLPYIQLFFGYVEVYAVVLAALSGTMFTLILHDKGKLPFWFLPPVFALQAMVHYLGVLLLPLLVLITVRAWKSGARRPVAAGWGLAVLVAFAVALGVGADRLVPPATHSHVLPLHAIGDEYTAYTLLSTPHLVDVVNILLLAAGPLFLAFAGDGRRPREAGRPLERSLVAAALPYLAFILIAKFDLGAAKDWDVAAPYVYPLALLGSVRFLGPSEGRLKAMTLVLFAMAVPTAAAVAVNAGYDTSVRRVRALMDPSVMPPGGIYQTSVHLSSAWLGRRQPDSMATIWEEYIALYPSDPRGYQKLAKSLWEKGEPAYGSIIEAMARWDSAAAGDPAVRRQYSQFCVMAGRASMHAGRFDEARSRFSRAAGIDPADTVALEGLAGANRMLGDSAGVTDALRRAAAAGSVRAARILESGAR